MHTSPYEEPLGFHERHVVENKDRAHPKLPLYMDNWDKALWAGGHTKPTRETYCERADYNERLGAFVWELPEAMHPDVFVAQTAKHWLESYTGASRFFSKLVSQDHTLHTIQLLKRWHDIKTQSCLNQSATMISIRSRMHCESFVRIILKMITML